MTTRKAVVLTAIACCASPTASAAVPSPDTSFGSGGELVERSHGGDPESEFVDRMVVDPDGRIVVVGTRAGAEGDATYFSRYKRSGARDRSFGEGGTALGVVGKPSRYDGLKTFGRTSAGEYILGMREFDSRENAPDPGYRDLVVEVGRDGTFGDEEVGALPSPPITAQGAGTNDAPSLVITRRTGGSVTTPVIATRQRPCQTTEGGTFCGVSLLELDIPIQTDAKGRTYVFGTYERQFDPGSDYTGFVVRLTPDFELDPSWGEGGLLRDPAGVKRLSGGVVLPSGKTIVSGSIASDGSDPLIDFIAAPLARLTRKGALDSSFGTGGRYQRDELFALQDLAYQPDGKLLGRSGRTVFQFKLESPCSGRRKATCLKRIRAVQACRGKATKKLRAKCTRKAKKIGKRRK